MFAEEFSTGYTADTDLPFGAIVSLESETDRKVVPSSADNVDNLLGVAVSSKSSLLNISSRENNVQVVTSGLVNVLVSDINGDISSGDYITVSEIIGVGKRADKSQAKILGVAKADFTVSSQVRDITTESGETKTVSIGMIPVLVQIGGNPNAIAAESFLPSFVQETANALAGKPVAPSRIIIALAILVGSLVGSTVLLYGAVSSAIISIGRNPLSNKSVYRGLLKVVFLAVIIIVFSTVIAYLVVAG